MTETVDQWLVSVQPDSLILWITLGVIVVALIALGTEFWVNLWGMIFSPSITFQRLLGESQVIPGIVVVAIAGMAVAVITNAYLSNEAASEFVIETMSSDQLTSAYESFDQVTDAVQSDFSMEQFTNKLERYIFKAQSMAIAYPIIFLIQWFLMGLAGQVASMITGNKAGHGLANLWAALPYLFLIHILINWFSWLDVIGSGFGQVMYYISLIWLFFSTVVMMREHGRYSIGKAIVATIVMHILTVIFALLAFILIIAIWAQVVNWL